MKESQVEKYLAAEVKKIGGRAYKFSSPGRRAVPDRLVLLPGGFGVFVEVKAPGKQLTPMQQREINYIRHLGFYTAVVSSVAEVNTFIVACTKMMHCPECDS